MNADPLRSLLRRPWRDVLLPPDAVGIPTMLSKDERRLLYSLARDYASGEGAIVDAGCFLGGSSAALLAGVRDRADPWSGPPVTSYDLFRVEAFTVHKFFSDDQSVRVGDSFRPRYDAHVARFDVPHVVHEGDITRIGWYGGPIDVLFLDVLKSWEINDAMLRDFFPSLVPGRSVIVHQDYGWGNHPWVPITVELMRDSLLLIDWMEWGSHVFLLDAPVPAELIESGAAGLRVDRRFELLQQAIERAEGWVRGMLEVSRTRLVAERDGREAALAELASIASRYRRFGTVVACVEDLRAELGVDRTNGRAPVRSAWTKRLAGASRRVGAKVRRR
jgi:hypothetical protein